MTAKRCKAFFDGTEIQVGWEIRRIVGSFPYIGRITLRAGQDYPEHKIADLVLKYGDDEVIRWESCVFTPLRIEKKGNGYEIVGTIKDRRWAWKDAVIFGEYNVRDDKNQLVEATKKNCAELFNLLFLAAGESDFYVDVSTDADRAPHVVWHYANVPVEMAKLARTLGVSIVYENDGTFSVGRATGTTPSYPGVKERIPYDDTWLLPAPVGPVDNPKFTTIYAGDTWFDSWLYVEPIGIEIGGGLKPIEMLSYAPEGGFRKGSPELGYDQKIRAKLRGTMPEEKIDKVIESCVRSVFRTFRIVGLPPGQHHIPGFTLHDNWDDVNEMIPGDGHWQEKVTGGFPWKFIYTYETYVSFLDDDGNLDEDKKANAISSTPKIGIGVRNDHNKWMLVNPGEIHKDGGEPVKLIETDVGLALAKDACELLRKTENKPEWVIVPPGVTCIDYRILLPLLGTRIASETDVIGKKARLPAEMCGKFTSSDSHGRNKDNNKYMVWKHGVSVDVNTGIVRTGSICWNRSSKDKHPEMYLRIGYGFRLYPYANRYHRRYRKEAYGLGNPNVPDKIESRTDMHEYRVLAYENDYNDFEANTVIANTAEIDAILQSGGDAAEWDRQNSGSYESQIIYTPIVAVAPHLEPSYRGGVGQLGETVVSSGKASPDIVTPYEALTRRLQQESIEKKFLDFSSAVQNGEVKPDQKQQDIQ